MAGAVSLRLERRPSCGWRCVIVIGWEGVAWVRRVIGIGGQRVVWVALCHCDWWDWWGRRCVAGAVGWRCVFGVGGEGVAWLALFVRVCHWDWDWWARRRMRVGGAVSL